MYTFHEFQKCGKTYMYTFVEGQNNKKAVHFGWQLVKKYFFRNILENGPNLSTDGYQSLTMRRGVAFEACNVYT